MSAPYDIPEFFPSGHLVGIHQFRKPIDIPNGVEYLTLDEMMVSMVRAINWAIIDGIRSAEKKGLTLDNVQLRWVNVHEGPRFVQVELLAHSPDYKGPLPIRPLWEIPQIEPPTNEHT